MKMDKNILVVDVLNKPRGEAICSAFKKHLDKVGVFLLNDDGIQVVGLNDSEITLSIPERPRKPDLIIAHDSDLFSNDLANLISDNEILCGKVICYSGGEKPDEWFGDKSDSTGRYWWVKKRPIASRFDAVTEGEAGELLEWLTDTSKIPSLLLNSPAEKAEHLIALSILCQGYLLVHYDLKSGQPHPSFSNGERKLLLEAAHEMGFTSLLERGKSASADDASFMKGSDVSDHKREQVYDHEWWLQSFSNPRSLLSDLKREWEILEKTNGESDFTVVQKLVETLLEEQPVRQVSVVAEAFLVINPMLKTLLIQVDTE